MSGSVLVAVTGPHWSGVWKRSINGPLTNLACNRGLLRWQDAEPAMLSAGAGHEVAPVVGPQIVFRCMRSGYTFWRPSEPAVKEPAPRQCRLSGAQAGRRETPQVSAIRNVLSA